MKFIETIVLGIVQGLTEFLPISSSGHLVIFSRLLEILNISQAESNMAFDVILHCATLVSVFIVFRKDVFLLIKEFFLWIGDMFHGKFAIETSSRKFLIMIIVGTVPAVILGAVYSVLGIEAFFQNVFFVALMLIVTGVLMMLSDRIVNSKKTIENATVKDGFWVGCFQAIALFPGLSRSGTTMFGGLVNGFNKKFAVKFSFILSIPAILGATVLEVPDAIGSSIMYADIPAIIIGAVVAAIVGIISIKGFVTIVSKNKLKWFSYYCWLMAVVAIVLGFIK